MDTYFTGADMAANMRSRVMTRDRNTINLEVDHAAQRRKLWKRVGVPFDIIAGHVKGVKVNKYH